MKASRWTLEGRQSADIKLLCGCYLLRWPIVALLHCVTSGCYDTNRISFDIG
ncbi:hypothetical protein ZHAS_00012947 [Anopheles sinensis]|uniref:Uncharacterized protein n=1 Tax=Anopheles sinensis TaxID=74873 RepID=A0A084W465_ANOSI|nr:hypothetical protein ZHAS_00012947 [Anopheles sinensis]